jgi:hypothetical protein
MSPDPPEPWDFFEEGAPLRLDPDPLDLLWRLNLLFSLLK